MNKKLLFLGCLFSAVASSAIPAQADIKYTQEMRMGDAGKDQPPMSKTTTYVKQGFERAESTTQFGPVSTSEVTLTLCEKNQRVRMNPKLKIYTVSPINGDEAANNDKPTDAEKAQGNDEPRGTGKMEMTYGVKDLGEETIAGFKTRHYMVDMQIKSSGCAGNSDTKTKMEIWVADIKNAHGCDSTGNPAQAMAPQYTTNCKISFEMKGDSDKITNIYKGLVMRMKMYNGDKVTMVQEITMLSQAKLEDDPFAIPADYQQVSAEEFQQKQSQAMMQAVMNQSKENNNQDNTDKEENNNGENQDNEDEKKDEEQPKEDQPEEEPKEEAQPKKKRPRIKLPF